MRLTVAQAAEHASCHPNTVPKALQAGELHGSQRTEGGTWLIRRECLEAWLAGAACGQEAAS